MSESHQERLERWCNDMVQKPVDTRPPIPTGYVPKAYTPASALGTQVAGGHYKDLKIQPVEYIHANGIGFFEGNVIKYVTRWRDKGGVKDLEKARHYIDLLIELEAKP
jgi:hypothetical protein